MNGKPKLFFAFASRLTLFTLNHFIAVRNAVTVVRFGNSYFADVCGNLTDFGLVDTAYNYFVLAGAFKLNAVLFKHFYGVGIADVEDNFVALLCNFPTYAVYLQGLLVAVGNADNHIVKKCPVKAVFCLVLGCGANLDYMSFGALNLDIDSAYDFLRKRTLCALYRDNAAFKSDGYLSDSIFGNN